MVVNRGVAAFRSGDLPAALSYLDEAASRYQPLGVPGWSGHSLDRCDVLLAAGLANDALAEADAAIRAIEQAHGWSTMRAELLLMAANCALTASRPGVALDRASAAYRLFRSQRSAWGQAHAGLVLVRAQYAAGMRSGQLLRAAGRAAGRLEALGSGEATQAHLLAGRVALSLNRRGDADRHLIAAAQSRRRGTAMSRASGWLSEALRAQAAADPRRLLAACRRGLEVLDEHRFTLGASELRAQATAHGAELAALAQRHSAGAAPAPAAARVERAMAGHRPRGPRCGPWPTRSSMPAWPPCARSPASWTRRAARARHPQRSRGNSDGSKASSARTHCGPVVPAAPVPRWSTSRNCSISSAPAS